jgi:hypothetical protein
MNSKVMNISQGMGALKVQMTDFRMPHQVTHLWLGLEGAQDVGAIP